MLRAELRGRWRQARRAVMVLLSVHGLSPAQIAELLECDASTVRRWIGRFSHHGVAGLADRPRSGRPRIGGPRLLARITALLEQAGPWTVPKLWQYLGRPKLSPPTLYRRLRIVAIWRRPELVARGDPDRWRVVAGIAARLRE
nr:helix-turn-helix domain-containing protein [Nonomuraea terrae]